MKNFFHVLILSFSIVFFGILFGIFLTCNHSPKQMSKNEIQAYIERTPLEVQNKLPYVRFITNHNVGMDKYISKAVKLLNTSLGATRYKYVKDPSILNSQYLHIRLHLHFYCQDDHKDALGYVLHAQTGYDVFICKKRIVQYLSIVGSTRPLIKKFRAWGFTKTLICSIAHEIGHVDWWIHVKSRGLMDKDVGNCKVSKDALTIYNTMTRPVLMK